MKRLTALFSLFLALSLPLLAAEPSASIYLAPKGTLLVLLQENAGTGYQWEFASPRGQVANVKSTTLQKSGRGVPGAPQFRVFEFEGCAESGSQALSFELRAPWEKGKAAQAFSVPVQGTRITSATEVTSLVYWVRPQTRFAVHLPLTAEGWSWKTPTVQDVAVLKWLGREGEVLNLQAAGAGQTTFQVNEEPTKGPETEPRRSYFVAVTVAR